MSSLGPQVANQALRLEDLVRHLLAPWIGREIRVLEAGCGASSPIDFGKRAYVIGLDIDEQAMRTNEKLDQRLVGDLESYPMAADAFDLVFCRWVLEHLRNPELALHNMRLGL